MSVVRYDVVGIGNAIVDVLASVSDEFLTSRGIAKGSMQLIDETQASALYAELGDAVACSGGSAANTMVGLQSLGSRTAYIGKVADDELGASFREGIRREGVDFDTRPLRGGLSTARCLVLVTPDAQRTMMTYLGASALLERGDIEPELIAAGSVTYLEGYLFDAPEAQAAFVRAAELAHESERTVALTLSDAFCVQRHHQAFFDLVSRHVDILFANESEITTLFEADFESAAQEVSERCSIAALTRGAEGAVVISGGVMAAIEARPLERLVDTTGAGDLFAAGFLHGLAQGMTLEEAGECGAIASAEIISHYGARPETPLRQLVGEGPPETNAVRLPLR